MTNTGEQTRPALAAYEDLARIVDYAVLTPSYSEDQVSRACNLARKYRVGRITVRPADLDLVAEWTRGSGVAIGTSVSYPHGADTTSAKLFATRDALQRGAKAIETVLNPGKMASRQFRYIESELIQMAQECHRAGAQLIVDFEMNWLPEDLRVIGCRIAKRADVDWVRTGTLFGPAVSAEADLPMLLEKLGDVVKLDAGTAARTLDGVLKLHASGVSGFQTEDPAALLDAWTAELKRREAEAAAAKATSNSTPAG